MNISRCSSRAADRVLETDTLCPICGNRESQPFVNIASVPVNCIALWPTREAAMRCATGSIELVHCPVCEAVRNSVFEASRVSYDQAYDNSLHFSAGFGTYAAALARSVVEKFELHDKDVIDIGCGNGEFLSLVCEMGNNHGVGFDPSFIPGRADLKAGKGISIIQDYYSAKYATHAADMVISRHVLEHIPDPRAFLRPVREILRARPKAAAFFEVPNALFTFRSGAIWDIIYEHCLYYTPAALSSLFVSCGFEVLRTVETFGGQYLCLEAKPLLAGGAIRLGSCDDADRMQDGLSRFAEVYRSCVRQWHQRLRAAATEGKRVVLWGAGAKGAMFLNATRPTGIDYIVDVNPHKRGLYIPGTGQAVVAPGFLREYQPDVVLIMNGIYVEEIAREISSMGINPELVTV